MGASAQGVSGVHSISGYSETVILWIPPKNDPYFTQHQTSGVGHLKGVLSGSATDGTIPGPGHRRDGPRPRSASRFTAGVSSVFGYVVSRCYLHVHSDTTCKLITR